MYSARLQLTSAIAPKQQGRWSWLLQCPPHHGLNAAIHQLMDTYATSRRVRQWSFCGILQRKQIRSLLYCSAPCEGTLRNACYGGMCPHEQSVLRHHDFRYHRCLMSGCNASLATRVFALMLQREMISIHGMSYRHAFASMPGAVRSHLLVWTACLAQPPTLTGGPTLTR